MHINVPKICLTFRKTESDVTGMSGEVKLELAG